MTPEWAFVSFGMPAILAGLGLITFLVRNRYLDHEDRKEAEAEKSTPAE